VDGQLQGPQDRHCLQGFVADVSVYNPTLGVGLSAHNAFYVGNDVSRQDRRHLIECKACSEELAMWISQARGSRELSLANDLIDRAMKSDPSCEAKDDPRAWRRSTRTTGGAGPEEREELERWAQSRSFAPILRIHS
jgi:hypothetical protein